MFINFRNIYMKNIIAVNVYDSILTFLISIHAHSYRWLCSSHVHLCFYSNGKHPVLDGVWGSAQMCYWLLPVHNKMTIETEHKHLEIIIAIQHCLVEWGCSSGVECLPSMCMPWIWAPVSQEIRTNKNIATASSHVIVFLIINFY
jgi:hypothetical protein